MSKRTIRVDMNRVEGDLEIKLEVDNNTVTDAWCVGKMYRGFVGCVNRVSHVRASARESDPMCIA